MQVLLCAQFDKARFLIHMQRSAIATLIRTRRLDRKDNHRIVAAILKIRYRA